MKTFSLIIPSRHRTQQLRGLLDSLAVCTERLADLEVILVVDSDDEETLRFTHDPIALKKVQVPPGTPMGALNAAGFEQATGVYLMLVNDDVIVRTPGWDRLVLETFRQYPDGIVLVHVNDLFFKDELCVFPFLTRQFCSLAAGICPPGYIRYGIDNHIQYTFESLKALGYDRRIYLSGVIFEHTNVQTTSAGPARYVPDPAIHDVDIRLLESLQEERDRVARAAAHHIERHLTLAAPSVTVAVLSADYNATQARKCVELLRSCTLDFHLILAGFRAPETAGAAMNRILAACATPYLVLMRDDVFVQPGWLEAMLRSIKPGVGVITPVLRDANGRVSNAGIAILPNGSSGPVLAPSHEPRRIHAPSPAIMLIDMTKCGHVRFDEEYAGDVRGVDYGLRIWEAGFQVVCSADAEVTCARPEELPDPADAPHFHQSWLESGRMAALRQATWKQFPEICWMDSKVDEINRLVESNLADEIVRRGPDLVRSVQLYPPLKNYIATLALQRIGDRPLRVDQPDGGHWALLCGLSGRPVLYESGFHGCNIILEGFSYYAVPERDGARYLRTLEADRVDVLKKKLLQSAHATNSGNVPRGTVASGPSLSELVPNVTTPLPEVARTQRCAVEAPALASRPFGNPLLHFCSEGVQQGLKPNPLFDSGYYLATNPDVAASGVNPLAHFLDSGASAGLRPNPLFDPAYYLQQYPDAAASGQNPLEHFLEVGARKGYKPCPLFDTAYYLARHPELVAGGINPLAHFLDSGAKAGYNPNPLFDTSYYAEHTADLGAMNPLAHFLEIGARQGRKPSALFDSAYYLAQNPDVAASGVNPLEHFLQTGASEGRMPNPFFDPAYYLAQNPAVKQDGQNPLVHFLETGAKAGRRPNPLFDCNYYLLQAPETAGINPLVHFLEHARQSRPGFASSAPYGGPNGHTPSAAAKLSVVIATRDQGESLSRTLEACNAHRGPAEIEIIVVDAGSCDHTLARLTKASAAIPGLRYYSLKDSTHSLSRNIGADLARNEVILFLDQHARPQNDDFFQIHASLHGRYSDANLAVLGSVRASSQEPVVSVLQKLLGRGAAQFGNLHLSPFAFVAWPFFDTANVSVKKTFVSDWILDGFNVDAGSRPLADLELACRIARSPEGIRVFYNPAARVTGIGKTAAAELEDQYLLGHAIAQLLSRNPELACDCTPASFLYELRGAPRESDENIVADYRRLIDGFKAWARTQDRADVAPATGELFLLDGFAAEWIESGGDAAVALPLLVNRFQLASAGLCAVVLGD